MVQRRRRILFFCGIILFLLLFFSFNILSSEYDAMFKYPDCQNKAIRTTAGTSKPEKQLVIILSHFRSGTSFFGELLHQYPDTFYHFEPLFMLTQENTVDSPQEVSASITLLHDVINCNFDNLKNSIPDISSLKWLFNYFKFNDQSSQNDLSTFVATDDSIVELTQMCLKKPIHILKINRLRLRHLNQFLQEFPNLKIIYLTRDPRAVYSSRKFADFCFSNPLCIDPNRFCMEMSEDLTSLDHLQIEFPGRIYPLSYEMLVSDIRNVTRSVFQFVDFDFCAVIEPLEEFIHSHMQSWDWFNNRHIYGTIRGDSKRLAYRWMETLTIEEKTYVTNACEVVLRQQKQLEEFYMHQ